MAVLSRTACGPRTPPGRLKQQVWRVALLALLLSGCAGQEQWGPFRGRIVDAETGAPIAGAYVMVTWYERQPNPVQRQLEFFDAQETVTDDDGFFELPGLDRTFNLTMEPPNFDYFAPGYLAAGREITPPDGHYLVDATVIRMRLLKTREERCSQRPGAPLHDKAPMYRDAVRQYRLSLGC